MTSDDAWMVAIEEKRVPEPLVPLVLSLRQFRTRERVWETMRS